MYETAKIQRKMYTEDGMYLQIFLPGFRPGIIDGKSDEECSITFNDTRNISCEQRKKIYATLADIAEYTGYTPDEVKQVTKIHFMVEKNHDYFSLKDCSVSLAGEYIDYLIDLCFRENIPLSDSGIYRTHNMNAYLKMCLKYKKCCICGKPADEHHDDAIGMGHDRDKVDDSKKRKTALCRCHHTERHTIGEYSFNKKYHVYGIIYNETIENNEMVPVLSFLEIA